MRTRTREPVTEDALLRLTMDQLSLLVQLDEASNRVGFGTGSSSGAMVKSLARRGWIRPFGKVGVRQRCQLCVALTHEQRSLIHQLMGSGT